MRKSLAAGLILALSVGWCSAAFVPTATPSNGGVNAIVDLPASQHMRNVGGSDGAGLCVFTSLQHAARWHNLADLEGFRAYMERRPGGGWPQKVDVMLAAFCKQKGIPVPDYVQHTGGDDSFLDLAVKTDRIVCVTYAGRDDFYGGRIAHMVNLAHLDQTRAAIIDNNRPGFWVWMTRAEFLARWRDMQGGWAVVFLAAPPPPNPEGVQAFGQCGPNGCPIRPATGPEPIGTPPSDRHEWGEIPGYGYGWRFKAAPAVGTTEPLTGVVADKIHSHPRYSLNGSEVSEADAKAALSDDSDRWHLTAVGDAAFRVRFKADVAALPADVRGKLLVQAYGADDWPVAQYKLSAGVNLRRPSAGRASADVGTVPAAEYTAAKLGVLLASPGGPVIPPPLPKVDPPTPKPVPDVTPAPAPAPTPAPVPPASGGGLLGWLVAAGLALFLVFRK